MLKDEMQSAATGAMDAGWWNVIAMLCPPFPRGCPDIEVENIDAAARASVDSNERAGVLRPKLAQNRWVGARVAEAVRGHRAFGRGDRKARKPGRCPLECCG